jgi:hypothetical protein
MRIGEPRLARALTRELTRRILMCFAGAARSVSDVASTVDEPVGKVFYHVRRLVDLGLLRVARAERRQGKPVKYYQSVAETFFLPAELIEKPFTRRLVEELHSSLEHNFYRSELEGVIISTDQSGAVQIELRPKPERQASPSAAELWYVLRLSDASASALAAELRELLEQYESRSEGREFLVHAAFARRC